jgi:[acyl-carrier-protein] S-malonyltransferase
VFLFPGQSSVRPDAIARACQVHSACATVAKRARTVLPDGDASAWLDNDNARLHSNRDVQVVVFLATQMYLAALAAEGVDADCSMGLSLGEYSHLVHIGALDFEDALRLVEERGRRFDEAPPGIMVTVLAVDRDAVTDVVARAGAIGHIVISNFNAPTQHVIAGDTAAVTWAANMLEDEFAAHTTVIERRVPMHSGLMAAPARSFARTLARTPWKVPALDYRPNVTGAPIATADPTDFVVHLTRHVAEPVQWQASVNGAAQCFGDATFVEVGPGRVLHNMLARSWKSLRRAHVDDPESADPREHFSRTVKALRA